MTSKQLYLRLLGYVRPYKKIFLLSILFTVILAITEPALPALFKPLLDGSFVEKDPTTIRLMPLALIGIFIVRGIAAYGSTMAIQWVANKVVMDLIADDATVGWEKADQGWIYNKNMAAELRFEAQVQREVLIK